MSKIHLHIEGSKVFFNLIKELELNYHLSFGENVTFNKKDILESNVRVIFPENLKINITKRYFNEDKPTIFFLENKNYLLKNRFNLLNFHQNLLLQIYIFSFIEILNILVSKYNFFKKSNIIVNDYEIDSNQRIILKKGAKVKLTEKELDLILCLNNHSGLEKSFLLKKIWNHNSTLETHAFETHLHRLRKKMEKFFKDKKFIIEKDSLYYLSK